MYVITVELRVEPQHHDMLLEMISENARASARDEPGCRQFDVCVDEADPGFVFLYEIYDDEAAFEAHQRTPHYARFNEMSRELLQRKETRRLMRHIG